MKLKKENNLNIKPETGVLKMYADAINCKPLNPISANSNSGPSLLLPAAENSLLRNNFQIYSDQIHTAAMEKLNVAKQGSDKNISKSKGISLSKKRVKLSLANSKKKDIDFNLEAPENDSVKYDHDKTEEDKEDEDNHSIHKHHMDISLTGDENYDDEII